MSTPGMGARALHGITTERDEAADYRGIAALVLMEIHRATTKFPVPFHSPHEGYAVLLEEVHELWDAVRADDLDHAQAEALQVAAMAIRFVHDTTKGA